MKTANPNKSSDKKIRFAEAGILFVLMLAVIVFVGVRVASHKPAEPETAATIDPISEAVVENTIEPDGITWAAGAETEAPPVSDHPTGENAEGETAAATETAEPGSEVPDPSPPQAVSYATAEAAYFEGRYGEAAELFTAYATDHPQNAWGFYMLGLSFWKDGCPEAAEESFRQALALKPEHRKSLVNLARVLLDMERADEAVELAEKAIEVDPEYGDAYRVLGRVFQARQQGDEAIQAYREAIRRNDQDAWALNNLGFLYLQAGQFEAALPPLARAVLLRDDIACFQNNLGMALERIGHTPAARDAYALAVAADPGHQKAVVNLARVEELTDALPAEAIDLAELAAGFNVEPIPVTDQVIEIAGTVPEPEAAENQDEDPDRDPTETE